MKTYYTAPAEEVRICKPDRKSNQYEIWVIKPVYVGTLTRLGTQRIEDEDGHHHTNLNSAAASMLANKGHDAIAKTIEPWIKKPKKKVSMSGMEIVSQNKWPAFAKLRKMDAKDVELLGRSYTLTADEMKSLKLEAP